MQGVQHFLWLASGPPEGAWDVEVRGVPFAVLSLSLEMRRVQHFLWPRGLGSPLGRLAGGNAKSTALSRCCTR